VIALRLANRGILVAIVLFQFWNGIRQAWPQEHLAKADPISLEVVLSVPSVGQRTTFSGLGDLGPLLQGKEYEVVLTLVNPHAEPIAIGQIRTSCACLRAVLEQKLILPKGTVQARLTLKVPHDDSTNSFGAALLCYRQDDLTSPIIDIRLTGLIEGNLGLPGGQRLLKVGSKPLEVRIPVIYSAPVKPENLEIRTSESLKDCHAIVVEADQRVHIEFIASPAFLSPGGTRGTVTVKDSITGASSEIELLLVRQEVFVVAPSIVRFRRSNNQSDRLTANTILQFIPTAINGNSPIDDFTKGTVTEQPGETGNVQEIACFIGDTRLQADVQKLAGCNFRMRVHLPGDFIPGDESELKWSAKLDGRRVETVTGYSIEGGK